MENHGVGERKTARAITKLKIGEVLVDTGAVLIVDPCRARERENHLDEKTGFQHGPGRVDCERACDLAYSPETLQPEICAVCSEIYRNAEKKFPDNEQAACREAVRMVKERPHEHELTNTDHRQIGYGAVCSTGIGDGTYPVFAIMEEGELTGVEIRFRR
jgi:hypothetical protein